MIGQRLIINAVSKAYGAATALHPTSLQIAAGEFVSIVGPSGSGKTTLLSLIAGFEPPTGGSISLGTKDITDLAANRRNIGMVFQKYALFPHMSVRDNIGFPLRMRGAAKSNQGLTKISKMLDLVELSNLADRYPHQLSGGQQQRVAVARALVFDPPLILMDEPLGALDKKLRESMQIEIKRIQHDLGATVIYVTHDQDEALTMSDRVAVMRSGRIEQIGAPDELYRNPQTPFVADFIGSMNFLPVVIEMQSSNKTTVTFPSGDSCDFSGSFDEALMKAGDSVLIALRPEQLRLGGDGDDENFARYPCIVEDVVFSGPTKTAHVRCKALAANAIKVVINNDDLRAPIPGDHRSLFLPLREAKLFAQERRAA